MNQLNRALPVLAFGALLAACGADDNDHGHDRDSDADHAHGEDTHSHEAPQTEALYDDEAVEPAASTDGEAAADGHAHGEDTHTHDEDDGEHTHAEEESGQAHGHDH